MKHLKIALYAVLMLFVGVFFTSCDKSIMDEPMAPVINNEEENLSQTRALQNGWQDEENANGIRYYSKKDESRTWYVIKIYLPQIKISPVYRIHSESQSTTDPTFYKQHLGEWNSSNEGRNAIALVNASFFNFKWSDLWNQDYGILGRKAEVAHPFGKNGNMISLGYESSQANWKTFAVVNKKAYIGSQSYYNPEITVTGFDPDQEERDPEDRIGRTMVGIPYNGSDVVYIFVTGDDVGYGAKQSQAINALRSDFGCSRIVMFDGSASSQFYWQGVKKVSSMDLASFSRRVPVVLRMDRR